MKSSPSGGPSIKKFARPNEGPPGLRACSHPRADREVVILIWGMTFFLLIFLGLMGGAVDFLSGLFAAPIAATVQIALSKMGGRPAWAWTMAGLHVGVCALWLIIVATAQ